MQKWDELWFQKTLFLSGHAAVYLSSVKVLFVCKRVVFADEKVFCLNHQWTIRTTKFGLMAGNAVLLEADFWLSEPISRVARHDFCRR